MRGFLAMLTLALCTAAAGAATMSTEIIELRHRPVDQVIEMLRPLVPPPGTVTGMHNQLIVRTTPDNLDTVRDILARIDTRLQRLRITVRNATRSSAARDSASVSGRYRIGDVTVGAGRPSVRDPAGASIVHRDDDGRIRFDLSERESEQSGDISQFVQVMEGGQAFIRAGQEVPVPQRTVIIGGRRVVVQDTTHYHAVTTGFYVRPRLNGDRVTLEISQHAARPGAHPYSAEVQSASTVVSGTLGEWIAIGGVDESADQGTSETFGRTRLRSSATTDIQLKVEIAP